MNDDAWPIRLILVKVVSQATIPKIASEMAAMMIMRIPQFLDKRKFIVITYIIIVIFMTHKTYKFILQIGVT